MPYFGKQFLLFRAYDLGAPISKQFGLESRSYSFFFNSKVLAFPNRVCFSLQMSGGNILVPIVAHVVYDLLTFLEVHQRATAQLEPAIKGNLPQKEQVHLFSVLLIAPR